MIFIFNSELESRNITPNSVAAGRYKLNFGKALSYDKKWPLKENCAASGQLQFFVICRL